MLLGDGLHLDQQYIWRLRCHYLSAQQHDLCHQPAQLSPGAVRPTGPGIWCRRTISWTPTATTIMSLASPSHRTQRHWTPSHCPSERHEPASSLITEQCHALLSSHPADQQRRPAISGWVSTANIEAFVYVNDYNVLSVGQPPASGVGGHTNVAYYSFEDNSLFAHDFSGNGNDINSYGNYSMSPYITNDAAAGSYAFGAAGDGWLYPPTNVLATLAGSFSVSLWVKTSEVHGNDNDSIYSAAGIVSALNGGQNTVVPMGLNRQQTRLLYRRRFAGHAVFINQH